ncbi:MAG: FAD binding domain-containing protein [Lachnospiraceae bacterium]|jgi:NADPH-dependent glutamate synthase beta subunit-like oxidoreductase/CO/xanthine dehydrogenase FAD-binding subunit|nr:FAD binding domain-containing protein [Lachnospiraceae bacterium]
MKHFDYARPDSFEAASAVLTAEKGSEIIAGGTDLLGVLKERILPEYPSKLVDIKHIEGAEGIAFDGSTLKIGATTKLTAVAGSEIVKEHAPLLAQAAYSVATPLIRNIATVGGNVCQDVRCWYYRYPHEIGGRLNCARKGGDRCYALLGDNRYHSVFGGRKLKTTPCQKECPASTDIPAYMEQIRKGDWDKAADILLQANPIPAITARVCAHFCQDRCNRCESDESVAVSHVERTVGDYVLENAARFYAPPAAESGKSVAVIGSGPSGLTAAYFLRKAGNKVTVYDSKEEAGGMLMYAIPAYRLPKDIVRQQTKALAAMGIDFVLNTQVGKDIAPADLEKRYDSVFYATGAWKRRIVGLAGEELTTFGLDFLVEVEKWFSGRLGDDVLVTGGGNVAMDVAITAKRLGAKKVTMACVESRGEMPASKEEIARAEEEGVVIMPSWGLSKVVEEGGSIKGMELKKCTGVYDENHRFNPQYDENDKIIVQAGTILMAIGQLVDLSFLDEKYQLQLTRGGLIAVADDDEMSTSRPGIFAGGDATLGPATVVQGVATGRRAAWGMCHYLGVPDCKGGTWTGATRNAFITYDPDAAQKTEPSRLKELPAPERGIDKEDSSSLTREEAACEAGRCLNCGCYAVNPSDLSPALIALGATIVTNKREVPAEAFFTEALCISEALKPGEIVTAITMPSVKGAVAHYDKFRLRDAIDFAIVSVATILKAEGGKFTYARVTVGGAAPVPIRLTKVEEYLVGKALTQETADAAADLAMEGSLPLAHNAFKIKQLRTYVQRAIMRLA